MRTLLLCAALALPLYGCLAPDGTLDVPATVDELQLTSGDLLILSDTATAMGKPETADALRVASDAIYKAALALDSGAPTADAWGLVDSSLDLLEAIAAKEQDGDLAIGVAAARIVLGRVKAHLPEPAQ
jgi:hypothetical protein